MLAVVLICLVRRTLKFEVLHHPPLGLQQPLRTRAEDRLRLLAAMLIELVSGLTQPALTALSAGHDDIGVKLELRLGRLCIAGSVALRARVLLALKLSLRLRERGTTALPRAQMLRQLIATILSIEPVLGRVDLARLLQDLPRELLVVEV